MSLTFKIVAKNTIFLSVSQGVARIIGFLYFIFLARILGVAEFGVYAFTIAFVYNFIPVADFGIERLVLRDISRFPEKPPLYFSKLLPARVALSFLAYFLMIFLGIILNLSLKQILYLSFFGLALFPYGLIFLYTSFLNAREKMEYMAGANIALIVLTALFGGIFAFLRLNLGFILLAYPLSNLILLLYFLLNSQKLGLPLSADFDKTFIKKTLKECWPFGFILILAVFYLRITVVVLGLLKGSAATGIYSSSYKFIEAGILVPQSLALALFPASSRLFLNDKKKLKSLYFKSVGVLLVLGILTALSFQLFSKMIIEVFYGIDYAAAVPAMKILGISFIFFFANAVAGNIIQNSTRVKQFLPLAAFNFIFTLILACFLINNFSFIGAAWAVVGGEVVGLVINNLYVHRILNED